MRHLRAAVLDGAAQIDQRVLQRLFARGVEQLSSLCSDARVGQQVLDQTLHAAGAVDGEGDELVGVRVQLALVAPGQQLGIAGHHAQRLLQVVGGDVGKLSQFLIRAIQLCHLLQQAGFGLFAGGDVADGGGHQHALGAGERTEHDFDGELAAILTPPESSMPVPICCARASSAERRASAISRSAKPSGMMFFTLLPHQFVAAVAKLLFRLHVEQNNFSGRDSPPPWRPERLPAVRGSGLPSAPDAARRFYAR